MPELPEVETTLRGIEPYLIGRKIDLLTVRNRQLRWPVEPGLEQLVAGQEIVALRRRGKYLLLELERGHLIIHLGMSGSISVQTPAIAPRKHDHIDLLTDVGTIIRYHDPRRFGAWLWSEQDPAQHERLKNLGVEPLSAELTADYLYRQSRRRKVNIKTLLMNSAIVVGIGNIYASEILFATGIRPGRASRRISHAWYARLVQNIRIVLNDAISQGGTTLRDYTAVDGRLGYFKQSLQVYGREDQACFTCNSTIRKKNITQRASFYCPKCQL